MPRFLELFTRELAGVVVTDHAVDAVGAEDACELVDDAFRRQRRFALAHEVEHGQFAGVVGDSQREAVLAAAGRIDERHVLGARLWRQLRPA